MSAASKSTPAPGDVVITAETDEPAPSFSVRQLPGAPQVSCNTQDTALHFARIFARRHHVAIWYCSAGIYTPIPVTKTAWRP